MSLRSLVGILLFIVPTLSFSQNVVSCEYFLGSSDPGEGNGTFFSAEDGEFNSALETVLETEVSIIATPGINVINVRMQDSNNNWGPLFKKVFFLESGTSLSTTFNITSAEYYFGVFDPGEGNGTPLLAFDGEYGHAIENVFADEIAPNLTDGQTIFNIRLKDSFGNWGGVFRKSIFVNQVFDEAIDFNIREAEFYFGNIDPGAGNGTQLIAFDGDFSSAVETVFKNDVSWDLPQGEILFNIRIKDANYSWGPVFSKALFIDQFQNQTIDYTISSAEYFWGVVDQVEGTGTPILAFDGDYSSALEVVFSEDINFDIPSDTTLFNLRVQDGNGNWGPLFRKTIFIEQNSSLTQDFNLTQAEYFIGIFDPGEGNGAPILAFDGDLNSSIESLLRSSLTWTQTSGPTLFNIRVKDVLGNWGPLFKKTIFPYGANPNANLVEVDSVWICPGDVVQLEYSGPEGYEVEWFDGSIGNSISFIGNEEGNYSLTATAGISVYTDQVYVGFVDYPIPQMNYEGEIPVCGSVINFTAQQFPNESYQWYFNDILITGSVSNNYLPTMLGEYYVEITNDVTGCVTNAEPIIITNVIELNGGIGTINSCIDEAVVNANYGSNSIYTWYFEGEEIVGQTSNEITVNESGSYSVSVDNDGCSLTSQSIDVVLLSELSAPEISSSGSIQLCNGNSVELSSDVAENIVWSTGETTQSIIVDTAGDYYLNLSLNGCDVQSNVISVSTGTDGCTDPESCSYDFQAICDDGSCEYNDECGVCGGSGVLGCMDEEACNFNPNATCDSFTCTYPSAIYLDCFGYCLNDQDEDGVCDENEINGCMNPSACNYNSLATNDDSSCTFPGCTNPIACNYNINAGCDNGSCLMFDDCGNCGGTDYPGCTIPNACNYDPGAGCNNGSCTFPGCTDSEACNYNPSAGCSDGSCTYPDAPYLMCNGFCINDEDFDGVCDELEQSDCTDPLACNYDENATDDDGSCWYSEPNYDCNGNCLNDSDGDGVCDEFEIFGCTDPLACNYDITATEYNGSCIYTDEYYDCQGNCLVDTDGDGVCDQLEIFGCTDSDACNYEPDATQNDGSCEYPEQFNDCDGNCINDTDGDSICDELEVLGCTDPNACNYNEEATDDDSSCTYAELYYACNGDCLNDTDGDGVCDELEVAGCTDASACNYNEDATDDDNSCTYAELYYDCNSDCLNDSDGDGVCDELEVEGCTDPTACNYNEEATDENNSCTYADLYYDCNGDCLNDTDGDGVCDELEVAGCTDASACNYNEEATDDDNSCTYAELYYDCNGDCLNDSDGDGVCDELEVEGCTDPTACNYNEEATDDDNSCTYAELYYDCNGDCLNDSDGDGVCDELEVEGCTDPTACVYDENATDDDGSCTYPGCMDVEACNYDSEAGCEDESCEFLPTYSIEGSLTPVPFNEYTYTYQATNESTYEWSAEGGVIMSGQGTNEVVIVWAEQGIGTVCVIETGTYNGEECLSKEVCQDVAVFPSSVEEVNEFKIEIYPNPTRGVVNIVTSQNLLGSVFQIFDLQGRIVFEGMINSPLQKEQLSLNSGMYNLVIVSENQRLSERIIVEN